MFYEAFEEYKNEAVFIKLMEEIQNMECSYFKSECYIIPNDYEKIDERQFRQMLKHARILYSDVKDYDLAKILIHEAFGSKKKYRYYKNEISNIKNHLYAKSIYWILKNKTHVEIADEDSYINKINKIEDEIDLYYITTLKCKPDDMTDKDIKLDDLLNPAFKEEILPIINEVENKANSPLTNEETTAICNYKLFEITLKYNGIFDFTKFKDKQNSFKDFKEIINLLSYAYYCNWVKDFMESECIETDKIENAFSKLPVDEIWDCVITDVMINSYIDIGMWNNGEQFNCSFESLFQKFDENYIHYTGTKYDKDAPLVKKIIDDNIAFKSKAKAVIRIRDTFKKIDPYGYISNFFNRLPYNMKNSKSTDIPEFSMAMIFGLLMYKYSFGSIKFNASDVSCCKLCECMNCYTELISRNVFAQEINKRDVYKAQCFLEKYLLNLTYNVNGIVRYSSCKFTSAMLRESYYNKLVCNRYILTYQKLCSLQNSIDIDITYFMKQDILNEYINIITYMLTLIKASSTESYQKIINSFKLYLMNDSQSPKDLILHKIHMKDESSDLSADDFAKIFGFDYYNTPKKRNKKHSNDLKKRNGNNKEVKANKFLKNNANGK